MKEINIGNLEFYNEIEIGDLQLDVKNIYQELEKIAVKSVYLLLFAKILY